MKTQSELACAYSSLSITDFVHEYEFQLEIQEKFRFVKDIVGRESCT